MIKKFSLILPTYNEKENIAELVHTAIQYIPQSYEIIIIDDNSPDGTAEIAVEISKKNKKVRIIKRTDERGLASAIARGVKESTSDVVCWMDADLSMHPLFLPDFLKWIPQYDVVVGSRYVDKGKDMRGVLRKFTSIAINFYAGLLLGFSIKDYDSGFIITKKSVFEKVKIMEKGYGQYCIRFLYDCLNNNLNVKEAGYVFTDRKLGKSKTGTTLWSILKHGWNYWIEITKIKLGK